MANTLTPIPGATFPGPVSQAAVCDGFFILTIQQTKEFFVSGALDATDWVTNGSAIVSVFADNIVSMLVHDREIHFWSDRERTVYYDSGNIFPFDVIPGTTIQAGSAAKSSPARLDDRVMWLNSDDNGTATVKMGMGYTPQRISTHALEFAMQGYARVDDAVGYTYQIKGHSFYVLYFPTPSKTWVYDATASQLIGIPCWHEWENYVALTGRDRAHLSQCQCSRLASILSATGVVATSTRFRFRRRQARHGRSPTTTALRFAASGAPRISVKSRCASSSRNCGYMPRQVWDRFLHF